MSGYSNELGRADGRWEVHAEQVADAVVQGQTAEPLLDELGGTPRTGRSTGVQGFFKKLGRALKKGWRETKNAVRKGWRKTKNAFKKGWQKTKRAFKKGWSKTKGFFKKNWPVIRAVLIGMGLGGAAGLVAGGLVGGLLGGAFGFAAGGAAIGAGAGLLGGMIAGGVLGARQAKVPRRKLLPDEIADARQLFGDGLRYDEVTVFRGGIGAAGSARTIRNQVHLEPRHFKGSTSSMPPDQFLCASSAESPCDAVAYRRADVPPANHHEADVPEKFQFCRYASPSESLPSVPSPSSTLTAAVS